VLVIQFDPFPAHQREPVGLRQQIADFGSRQRFAVEGDLHLEVEQRVLSQPRRCGACQGEG
jgi:hypothetical protein